MKRNQFTFYRSFFEAMSELNLSQRGKAVTILCEYALMGIEPEPQKGKLKIYWNLVQPNLRTSRKRALAGQVGAAVTNQICSGKKEIEKEIENEIEIECESNKRQEANGTHRENFKKFWNLYPVKIGKEKAWGVWQHMSPDPETVCQALALWMKSRQWTQEGTRFVPLAENFLKQEYFRQRPEVAPPCGALGQLGEAEMKALEKIMRED